MNRRLSWVLALVGTVSVLAIATMTVLLIRLAPPPSGAADVSTTRPAMDEKAIFDQVEAIIDEPSIDAINSAAAAMGDSGDPAWVPYLIDLVRFFGVEETIDRLGTSLAALTGEPVPNDPGLLYPHYGQWMYDEKPLPYHPPGDDGAYLSWKTALYSQADPAFAELLSEIDDPILASQVQWGGVRRGGIPELDAPATVTVDQATWMVPEELTFGAAINGEVRAYPHRILDNHEMANDTLGGEPVTLADCTLCRTGVLFSRRVGDEVLEFESSGLLWNSNKVMVDVNTDSLWNQLTGEAIAGPLVGTVLDRFPITVTTYGDWVAEHPDTTVVDIPGRTGSSSNSVEITGSPYSYEPGDAYADYYASPDVWWPAGAVPDVFADKDLVATLDFAGRRLAVGVDALAEAGPQEFTIAGRHVVAVPTDGGARFYAGPDDGRVLVLAVEDAGEDALALADGSTLQRVPSGHSFWFAWYANYPDTAWWPD
jgi:Protein of unknown function (DUF3179)